MDIPEFTENFWTPQDILESSDFFSFSLFDFPPPILFPSPLLTESGGGEKEKEQTKSYDIVTYTFFYMKTFYIKVLHCSIVNNI